MPDLGTILIGSLVAAALVYWGGLTVVIVAGGILAAKPDSVLEGVSIGFQMLPVAILGALFWITTPTIDDPEDPLGNWGDRDG